MSNRRVTTFLDEQHVPYVLMTHSPAYSAQRIAQAAHIPGRRLAKTVLMEMGNELAMLVVPADARCRIDELARITERQDIALASERDIQRIFSDCDLGAVPPFGMLWNIPVYLSRVLAETDDISFPDGDVREIITMSTSDFLGLVEPHVVDPAVHS